MENQSQKIIALLGPTNTGKTHVAIEKMLEHDTGIFGLPLRLLAREVYDKCIDKVGVKKLLLLLVKKKLFLVLRNILFALLSLCQKIKKLILLQ